MFFASDLLLFFKKKNTKKGKLIKMLNILTLPVLELIITKTINVRPSTTTCSVEDKFLNYQENQAGFIAQPDSRLEQSYGDFAKRSDP